MANYYTPTGQVNVGNLLPTQDASLQGTPMYVEDYDTDNNLTVDSSELVGGRTGDELFEGSRIVGKPVDDSGIGDNKILRYDLDADKFVFATATGESNLADLADVEDGSPDENDTVKWTGAEWQFGGVTMLMMDQPLGSGLKVGTIDSVGDLVIMGVEDSKKSLTFKSQVTGVGLQDRWEISVDEGVDSGALVIEGSPTGKKLKIHETSGKVEMEILHLGSHTAHPTQVAGGMYYNSSDETFYLSESAT